MDHFNEIITRCIAGSLPRLPFLLEERQEGSHAEFFKNPKVFSTDQESATNNTSRPLLSLSERKQILSQLLIAATTEDSFQGWWQDLPGKCQADIILFLSEHSDGSRPWSSQECEIIVGKICQLLSSKNCTLEQCQRDVSSKNDLSSWLIRNFEESLIASETDFNIVLRSMKKKFTKDDWKYFPASVHGFEWIVKQVQSPNLSDNLELLIPPTLMFIDDYYDDFRQSGLKTLFHIVCNVDNNDLLRNNWASVIYDAVRRLFCDKNPVVIHHVMSVLMIVLKVIEKNPAQNSSEFTKYDDIMKQLLFQMDMSKDLDQKCAWFLALDELMKQMGLSTLHWSDRICETLKDATICNDTTIWKHIVKCTATLIRNTWVKVDCERISEIILRVLLNTSSFESISISDEDKSFIYNNATYCFQKLQKCDGCEDLQKQLNEITSGNSTELHPAFVSCLKKVRSNESEVTEMQLNHL